LTPRQAKLVRASEAADAQKRRIERMLPSLDRSIADAWQLDIASLDLASKTVMAVAEDPDAHGDLITLRGKDRAAYDAIMVLVRIELERKPMEQAA
jgi:hypothetical protein